SATEQQRRRGVQGYALGAALLAPVVHDGAAGGGIEPRADAIGAAVGGEPARGLEKDLTGQILRGLAIAHLGIDEAVNLGGILLKGAAKRFRIGHWLRTLPAVSLAPLHACSSLPVSPHPEIHTGACYKRQ